MLNAKGTAGLLATVRVLRKHMTEEQIVAAANELRALGETDSERALYGAMASGVVQDAFGWMFSTPIIKTVQVTVEPGRRPWFACPNCEQPIRYDNAYPFSFQHKVCGHCGWLWEPTTYNGIGPHREDITERITRDLELSSSGHSVSDDDDEEA